MTAIISPTLTLTTVGSNTTIEVKYTAQFTVFERRLAGLGLVFQEQIFVIGIDPPGSTAGPVITQFPFQALPVTDDGLPIPQFIARVRSLTVPRSLLQEDSAPGDNDEIRCRINIASVGLPPALTPGSFTNQEILVG
jgi:hypothetical protein